MKIATKCIALLLAVTLAACPSARTCATLNRIADIVGDAREFAPPLIERFGSPEVLERFNASMRVWDDAVLGVREACSGTTIDQAALERWVKIGAGAAVDIISAYLTFRRLGRAGSTAQPLAMAGHADDQLQDALADALKLARRK
jgi:hypothetical protein